MNSSPHILVVDDHAEIRSAVALFLEKNGMRASSAKDATEMDALLAEGKFDLIVLDVMMPGEDGLAVCQRLSGSGQTPILLLTALGEDENRIIGLESGADDYLAKPFNPRELLARIRAILRRTAGNTPQAGEFAGKRVRFAQWVLDCDRRTLISEDGRETSLTGAEFKLLITLLARNRLVLSRDLLVEMLVERPVSPTDRIIDNQISRLRRKIEKDPLRPRLITTVRNAGYCLAADIEIVGK